MQLHLRATIVNHLKSSMIRKSVNIKILQAEKDHGLDRATMAKSG
jgi:hypothetical protein